MNIHQTVNSITVANYAIQNRFYRLVPAILQLGIQNHTTIESGVREAIINGDRPTLPLTAYIVTHSLTHVLPGDDAMVSLLLYSLNEALLSLDTRALLFENCINLASELGFHNVRTRLTENWNR